MAMRHALLALFVLTCGPVLARAQGVPVKSIPIAEGDQFLFLPSARIAMGSVGIAVEDRYADPFTNPAKAVLTDGLRFTGAPVYYGLSGDGGSGRTLPLGGVVHRGSLFGGALFAYQELLPERERFCCTWGPNVSQSILVPESNLSLTNTYVYALGGTELPMADWSLGVSFFQGNLEGMEGVTHLYSANTLRQYGSMQQYRVGLYRGGSDGHQADVVVMHHRFDMTHELWRNETPTEEYDRTLGLAVQSGYRYALSSGWTLGARVTGDWKWHPKIPNYDLMNIPRDPGNSSAYNFGLGIASTAGGTTVGMDLIFEPIRSHTWAEAAEPEATPSGATVAVGAKTVDNQFDFANAHVRMGVHHDGDRLDLAFGLDMHRISYDLDQMDYVDERRRYLEESWTEWTASGGFGFDLDAVRIQYAARLTLGTGRPGIQQSWGWIREGGAALDAFSGDWVVAPEGPLVLDEVRVLSHQVAIVLPLAR